MCFNWNKLHSITHVRVLHKCDVAGTRHKPFARKASALNPTPLPSLEGEEVKLPFFPGDGKFLRRGGERKRCERDPYLASRAGRRQTGEKINAAPPSVERDPTEDSLV